MDKYFTPKYATFTSAPSTYYWDGRSPPDPFVGFEPIEQKEPEPTAEEIERSLTEIGKRKITLG